MVAAIVLFALAASGGLLLARLRVLNKPLPMPLSLLHGALAAAGLIALIVAVGEGAGGLPTVALVLFVIAALGGFLLFSMTLRKKQVPIPVVAVHAIVAAVALVVLIVGVVKAS